MWFTIWILAASLFSLGFAFDGTNLAAKFAGNHSDDRNVNNAPGVGNFVLVNQCNRGFYYKKEWYMNGDPIKYIPARTAVRQEFMLVTRGSRNECCPDDQGGCNANCGVTFKISDSNSIVDGNHLNLEYAIRDGKPWYDISFVNCAKNIAYRSGDASNCPSWHDGIKIDGQRGFNCEGGAECKPNEMCIYDKRGAYYVDYPVQKWGLGEPVHICPTYQMELYYRLCTNQPEL
ncbi:hypothetical protein BDV96DRAFT_600576 [Lophiotrema nucula]|uniref:Thaumatin n=1 Tax=Lophiotrema nucula TaxID=690887 RepID=A0A6A5Z6G6_9PLEO|nr:hypothetical protein BDV96DRAFT_600576 [Lophiotrema nucula]